MSSRGRPQGLAGCALGALMSRRRAPQGLATRALGALLALLLAGCGASASLPSARVGGPALPAPLATSLQSATGTWATLPMGHLNEPLNTFWQLFYRPAAGGPWSNHVEATAEATNGGLVLASPPGQGLIAAVRPSYLLTFSPLIYTADAGASWSTGLVAAALADRQDALAAASPSQALALVSAHGHSEVLASNAGLNSWHTLVSEATLARTPAGRSCALSALTAVAYIAGASPASSPGGQGKGEPLVAGSCANPGVVGMFTTSAGGGWQLIPLAREHGAGLPAALAHDRVEVLSAQAVGDGLRALLALEGGRQAQLLVVWLAGGRWRASQPLPIPAGATLASFAPASPSGIYALFSAASPPARLVLARGPGASWQALPAPPSGTATVAAGPAGSTEALAVTGGNVLTVWSLAPGASTWARRQTLEVHVEYGSSE